MYSEIAANKRHTVILIGLFSVLIVLIGFAFGAQVDYPIEGMIIALFVSVVMTLVGYYKGDAVALAVSGAQPIEQRDNPVLYRTVENLAIAGGLATPKIYVMSDPSPNAFATGRDPAHASLAVTTGLLEIMEPTELEGVIAHELSHVKNYDVRLMTIVVVLVGVVVLFSDWFLRMTFFRRRDSEEGSNQFTLILFIVGLAL